MNIYSGPLVQDARYTSHLKRVPPPTAIWVQGFSTTDELGSQNPNDGQFLFGVPEKTIVDDKIYTLIASGVPDVSAVPDATDRAALIQAMRIAAPAPAGASIADLVLHALINGDPKGQARVRVMQPTKDAWTFQGPDGVTASKPFDFNAAESAGFKTLMQDQYRALQADADAGKVPADLPAKFLGGLDVKFDRDDSEVWAVPSDVIVVGGVTKKPPTTQVSDNFNRADANTFGAAWVADESAAADYGVVSNQGACKGSTGFHGAQAFYNTPLSSADHWAQANLVNYSDFGLVAVFTRGAYRASNDYDCYSFQYLIGFGVQVCNFNVWVAQVENQISSDVNDTASANDLIKFTIASSALEGFRAGVSKLTLTDTTLAPGLLTGARILRNDGGGNAGTAVIDNFVGDDGITAATIMNMFLGKFGVPFRGKFG
jgi:hypothetical protein